MFGHVRVLVLVVRGRLILWILGCCNVSIHLHLSGLCDLELLLCRLQVC